MEIKDSLLTALSALSANRLRTALTMLGVIIGVGSVIAMIGIGEGTKQKSMEQLEIMGSKMITVMPMWNRGGSRGGADSGRLFPEDVEDIRAAVPTVELITGAVRGNVSLKLGNRSRQGTEVWGAEPQIAVIRNATKMFQGRWYSMEDEYNLNRVVVLGYTVYEELFEGENAIGSTVKVNGQNFEVIGVVTYKGGSGWRNPDEQIYMPLATASQRLLGKTTIDFITMQALRTDVMMYTQEQVEAVLGRKRKSAAGEEQFRVMNQQESIETVEQQSNLLSMLLAGIASVSLLVGGIGIMNIMLVSVTERTREIGLRKAIGAQRSTILFQFLLESVVLCLSGGVIGILLGYMATRFVAETLQVPPVLHTWAVVMAFGFSAFIGLFFGLYPAMRASNLQPIEALRYE